jgi:hypothetical protein
MRAREAWNKQWRSFSKAWRGRKATKTLVIWLSVEQNTVILIKSVIIFTLAKNIFISQANQFLGCMVLILIIHAVQRLILGQQNIIHF